MQALAAIVLLALSSVAATHETNVQAVSQTRGLIAFGDFNHTEANRWVSVHDPALPVRPFPINLRRIGDSKAYTVANWQYKMQSAGAVNEANEDSHIFSPTGLLDDSWWHRGYYAYGNGVSAGAGWSVSLQRVISGKLLCADGENVDSFGRLPKYRKWTVPLEFQLTAVSRTQLANRQPARRSREHPFLVHWGVQIPMLVKGMFVTDNAIVVVGPRDLYDEEKVVLLLPSMALADTNPFVGHWALTLPAGNAGWLGVEEANGQLQASILWGGGSVVPVSSAKVDGNRLVLTRVQVVRGGRDKGKKITETITGTLSADTLKLVTVKTRPDAREFGRAEFSGRRTPPLPPRPDLFKVKFAEPIVLFNGKNLDGWESMSPNAAMGWSVKDGVLMNRTHHEPGTPRKAHTNIRTIQEFEDFNLTLEARTLKDSNSGVYLRGIYEVQVFESYGRPVDSHNMGAVYSRICPTVAAEKPIGEWQTLDITLVDRHVTVILNGQKIIDNQPVLGCTGGALWSDPLRPGPIYLQGNHSDIDYRNIVLRPVVK